MRAALVVLVVCGPAAVRADTQRTIAGSVQLDYLAVPTESTPRAYTFDGATTELSLKMSVDFSKEASATVKVCFACHGFEAAAAFVDLRAADELTLRVGRMSPEFGAFPSRYDPANHRTSDKPLPYDMGRMLRRIEWNEGVLPAPWVDNGLEVLGTHFFQHARIDYAAYALSGPKGDAGGGDFDFVASHTPSVYYVDNNSEPIVGGRLAGTIDLDDDGDTLAFGASAMAGHYDAQGQLAFSIVGVDVVAKLAGVFVRAEYLQRRTDMGLGASPATRFKYGPGPDGMYDTAFHKHGYYVEGELPLGRVDLIARWDGLVRVGNVLADSPLAHMSTITRYTGGFAVRLASNIRLKASAEYYVFSDFPDEVAIHLGLATPF
jgi:hypothetical protein